MRQLFIQVPQEKGEEAVRVAENMGAVNLSRLETRGLAGDERELIILHISNQQMGMLLERLKGIEELEASFLPYGAIALRPPPEQAPQQVRDVEQRSPLEILLSGIQSVGSWIGFLGFSAAAGAVVWIGLYTDTIFLLIAAMLIAPYAGPAMTAALATASGDPHLLKQSLLRYTVALFLGIIVAAILTFIAGMSYPTSLMLEQGEVPLVAWLLPLVAGAAGALTLSQSDRDSLVSEAAAGMLVAASLAPPVGLVGMSVAMGRFDLVLSSVFLLVLQLVGINLSGAIVFRLSGVSTQRSRFAAGRRKLAYAAWTVSFFLLAGLIVGQVLAPLELSRGQLAQQARTEVIHLADEREDVSPLEVESRFARTTAGTPPALLVTAHLLNENTTMTSAELREEWQEQVEAAVETRGEQIRVVLDISLHEAGSPVP